MKIFFDTEFTGLHKDTTLISIGCTDENGRSFYAELTDYDRNQCDEWIEKNVIANLTLGGKPGIKIDGDEWTICGNRKAVAKAFLEWTEDYESVELVSDVSHYDMVLFISLFGTAFDLPDKICPCCHDINQDIATYFGISEKEAFDYTREDIVKDVPVEGEKHNSLYDAKVIKAIYRIVA